MSFYAKSIYMPRCHRLDSKHANLSIYLLQFLEIPHIIWSTLRVQGLWAIAKFGGKRVGKIVQEEVSGLHQIQTLGFQKSGELYYNYCLYKL